MKVWRPRSDPVRIFGRRLLSLALFIIVVIAISGVWNAYQKERESAALRAQAEAQLQDLSGRRDQLTADIARLKTDRGMEEALRQEYDLAAKGEQLIVIVDPPKPEWVQASSTILERIKHFLWPW